MKSVRNQRSGYAGDAGSGPEFPAEAYTYNAPVTKEALASIRARAAKEIDAEEWETVDAFGRVVDYA